MKWYIVLFGWMNERASIPDSWNIPSIFQESERVRPGRCGAAMMVRHISGIFQASERVRPGPLHSIHPNKHQTMSDPVPFYPGRI
jgi:hypothetical protein